MSNPPSPLPEKIALVLQESRWLALIVLAAFLGLALSGYTDVDTISQAINQGAVYRFLLKPWDDADLREHVRAAFREAEQRGTADRGG